MLLALIYSVKKKRPRKLAKSQESIKIEDNNNNNIRVMIEDNEKEENKKEDDKKDDDKIDKKKMIK